MPTGLHHKLAVLSLLVELNALVNYVLVPSLIPAYTQIERHEMLKALAGSEAVWVRAMHSGREQLQEHPKTARLFLGNQASMTARRANGRMSWKLCNLPPLKCKVPLDPLWKFLVVHTPCFLKKYGVYVPAQALKVMLESARPMEHFGCLETSAIDGNVGKIGPISRTESYLRSAVQCESPRQK